MRNEASEHETEKTVFDDRFQVKVPDQFKPDSVLIRLRGPSSGRTINWSDPGWQEGEDPAEMYDKLKAGKPLDVSIKDQQKGEAVMITYSGLNKEGGVSIISETLVFGDSGWRQLEGDFEINLREPLRKS